MTTTVFTLLLGLLLGSAFTTTTNRKGLMSTLKTRLLGSRRRKVATTVVTLALLGASIAAAAWLISSTGQGAGRLGNISAPVITGGTPTDTILPGSDGDGVVHINNTNKSALKIVEIADGGDDTIESSDPACYPYWNVNSASVNAATGLSIEVPKGETDVVLPGVFHIASDVPQACAGSLFRKGVQLRFSTK